MKKQYTDKSNIQIKKREINFKYEIIDKIECGIELKGTEVKSIRDGMCNLKDSFALIRNGEIMLKNMHVSPYDHGNRYNTDPLRDRKLLVHKKEVLKLLNYIKKAQKRATPYACLIWLCIIIWEKVRSKTIKKRLVCIANLQKMAMLKV